MNAVSGPAPTGVKAAVAPPLDFVLRGEHIALDTLLKATGLAPSGGLAKAMVADGQVRVDGQVERRKTCKIRAGQVVAFDDVRVRVQAAPATG